MLLLLFIKDGLHFFAARHRLSIKVQTVKKKSIIFESCIGCGFSDGRDFSNTILPKNAYCATRTLPYLCTPTGVSCLSLEPFSTVHQRAEKDFSTRWDGLHFFAARQNGLLSEITIKNRRDLRSGGVVLRSQLSVHAADDALFDCPYHRIKRVCADIGSIGELI